jgi:hypothetical protein
MERVSEPEMSALLLKIASVFTTLAVLAGSAGYAVTHLKNVHAPLQPPVAETHLTAMPSSAPTATLPPLVPLRGRTRPPSAQGTPIPSLAPNVRSADLPPLTFTHTS